MFSRLVGNQRAQETLRRMLAGGRVPGALLFTGEDGVGKKLFAVELARALNCRERVREGVEACGRCSSCERAGTFTLPAADDNEANRQILWSAHRDVGLLRPAGRFITVQQVRELERETNFRPYEGRARVFIIEDSDRLNESASNALLKTLEEPHPTSHLVLVTSRPASLLPTIRSRCQAVRFSPLSPAEIEDFLVKGRRRSGEEARLAARFARGRLAHALALNLDEYRARRDAMLAVLDALIPQPDRSRLLRTSEELSDAKRKEDYEPRLEALETLVRDVWLLTLGAPETKVVNEDLLERLKRLSAGVESRRAARWLNSIENLRGQLAVNINRRIATDALFLSMEER